MTTANRIGSGVPTGGQFATTQRAEADVELGTGSTVTPTVVAPSRYRRVEDIRFMDARAFATQQKLGPVTDWGSRWATEDGYDMTISHDEKNGVAFLSNKDFTKSAMLAEGVSPEQMERAYRSTHRGSNPASPAEFLEALDRVRST